MCERQVIAFHTDGKVSGLQRKPGEGLDLRILGHASIVRASEVLWDEAEQKWFVKILIGKYAGKCITGSAMYAVGHRDYISASDFAKPPKLFTEYDTAVKAEVMVLDHIRFTEGPMALQEAC